MGVDVFSGAVHQKDWSQQVRHQPSHHQWAEGEYEVAFSDNNRRLQIVGTSVETLGVRMLFGTSPSIAGIEW